MTPAESPGSVVWTRQVDHERAAGRWMSLAKWYGIPSAIALVVAVAAGGIGAMLGVLILLGGFGLLLVIGIWVLNRNLASNPEIQLIEGQLILGPNSVSVAEIEFWTTAKLTNTSNVGGPAAVAKFRIPIYDNGQRRMRPDGGPAFDTIDFAWAEMTVAEIDGVRQALESHITAPWMPMERLAD